MAEDDFAGWKLLNQTMPNATPQTGDFEVKLLEQEKLSLVVCAEQATVKNPKPSAKKASQQKAEAQERPKGSKEVFESSLSSKFSDVRSVREAVFNNARLKPVACSLLGASASKSAGGGPSGPPAPASQKPQRKGQSSTKGEKKGLQSGLYFFDETVLGVHLVEVLEAKKSEQVGAPGARVVYWRRSKSFVLEDGQLFKVALREFRKTRFGLDLSRAKLQSLSGFECVVLQSSRA